MMIAAELFSTSIPPLKPSDTVQYALDRMADFKLFHLPVVADEHFLGLISEEELIEKNAEAALVSSIHIGPLSPFVFENIHIYDVIRLFAQLRLSVVPVLSVSEKFLGLISIHTILEYVASMYSVMEPGGIIVLEVDHRNNSLAHMSQIIESENAQILSSNIRSIPDTTKLEITLKTNKTELKGIVAAFERYNYQVKSAYTNFPEDDGNEDRYNSLMNYLNV